MGGHDQSGARGAQRGKDKTQLGPAEARDDEVTFPHAHAVQAWRVVQAEESVSHAALLGEGGEHGSDMLAYPLDPTWCKQLRK